jgi:hypothetical protein
VKGSIETAREPESAKGKGPLGVGDMIQHLPDTPFIRCVAVQGFFFGDLCERCLGLCELILDRGDRVVAGYLVDVGEIVGATSVSWGRAIMV